MKKYHLFLLLFLFSCRQQVDLPGAIFDPLPHVDPFIGAGFHGHTFPGATTPFGMVQLSPDTRLPGWDASSGYHYSDSTIYGFSHTHLSGTGIGDMGDILFLPFTGEPADTLLATFDKATESASPGYYRVELENYGVDAELTATPRTGLHRYRFPDGQSPYVLIDLGHILQANWGHRSLAGEVEIIDNYTLRGKRVSSGWAYDHPVYFYAKFSAPFTVHSTRAMEERAGTKVTGKDLKVILTFSDLPEGELLTKVGISSVDEAGARANLEAENPDWDFDAVRTAAEDQWRAALGKIEIETSEPDVMTNFYTALYHSMIVPMIAQDVDGRYRGMDKQIHQAEAGYTNYTVFSLWDTFRAFHPLMTIIDEQRTNEWVKALLRMYEEGGVLPKWPLASNYTGTMVGYPAASVIADAMMKNIGDFDQQLALEAAVFSSEYHPEVIARLPEPRAKEVMPKHLDFIAKNKYIPADSIQYSVSYGLECAYYDWCIAQMAQKVGDKEIENTYRDRAKYYQLYFDDQTGFMRGKLADGSWRTPFSPRYSDHEMGAFVEGNAWQWSWFVPHDAAGLMELMGGREAFINKLDSLFTVSSEIEGERASADITGLIGQYAHGNEPSHHVIYFYHYAGQPQKARERLNKVLRNLYAPTPAGISGNEDCGQMSAWYVLNALGFYQPAPGDPTYAIGRPLVDGATIKLSDGGSFRIEVENNSPENKYVERMEINGRALETPFFGHEEIRDGGVLRIWMGENQ